MSLHERLRSLILVLALAPLAAHAAQGSGAGAPLTGTAKLAGLEINLSSVEISPEDGFMRVLVDLFPYRQQREKLGVKFTPKSFASALLAGPVLKAQPKLDRFRIFLVEYAQRDDYSQPVYASMKPLWRADGRMTKGKPKFEKAQP